MITLIDIGNTSIHFALEKNGKIKNHLILPLKQATKNTIRKVLLSYKNKTILISSVVPQITRLFYSLRKEFDIKIAGKNLKIPIKSHYKKKDIGIDRLAGAFAASNIYQKPRIIIDFGSAITFDFLSKSGEYLGGFILPGIGSTVKVFSNCALLPNKIVLKKKKSLIPHDTQASISKGIEEGFSAMVNALAKKYKKQLKLPAKSKIIITGGDARFILPNLTFAHIYEPNLVFKGLLSADQFLEM